jgi:hypothetical protein
MTSDKKNGINPAQNGRLQHNIKSVDDSLLRDYFAGQAINGLLNICADYDNLAEQAYEIADSMMAARGI